MSKKKIVLIAVCLILSLVFFAACNGAGSESSQTNDPAPIENADPNDGGETNSQEPNGSEGQSSEDEKKQSEENEQQDGEETEVEPTILSVKALLSANPTEAKALGDKIAKAIINKYSIENPIYCGYSFFDENDKAEVAGMTVSVATKIDDTERKFANYRVVFDPVKLDDIASGTYTLSHTKVAMGSQQTYDAKEKQNDQDFLDSLYAQDDFAYVAYENESFPSITMQELLSDYGDIVNTNLATHYDNALQDIFGRRYSTFKDYVTNYQWDLGDVNDNDEIQHSKVTLQLENGSAATLFVFNVDFANPININDLKDASKINNSTATYSQKYSFSYDNTIQGTRTELVNAILDKAITDGFDYQNAEIIFKDNGSGLDSDLGTVKCFTIVVSNNSGIKQINFSIQTADNDQSLINKINNGKFKVDDYLNSVEYSNNLLAEYDFEE
ncbi:MAG: hypothetical protein K5753_02855 [Clostridia bacterium]|nr:hypothetical protein [Clostridia bacterium]